jgi:hypothetical protein
VAKHANAGKTVAEILRGKKGRVRRAALDPGSPDWDDILHLTWEEIEDKAKKDQPGFRAIHKLLAQRKYNKK